MVPSIRQLFNQQFSEATYQIFLTDLDSKYPGAIEFRIAETPIFIDKVFKEKMLGACEAIVDVITQPDFLERSANAIPNNVKVPGEKSYSDFIAFDFGICESSSGALEPQLIEMQGFPTLFAYQIWHEAIIRKHFTIPDNYSAYFNGYTPETYTALLKEIIVGNYEPEEVILLEILPHQQKTKIDFYCTTEYIGIPVVCLTELIQAGKNLFYKKDDQLIPIKRIYNRIIFDDLQQQSEAIQEKGKLLLEDLNVEWVPHPNWFYRISKHTLPFINNPYVPETRFLNEVSTIPEDLEN